MTKRKQLNDKTKHHNQTPKESLPDIEIAEEIAKGANKLSEEDLPKRENQEF
ncbi:hypothetical protein [Pseudalkalibacillus berkeleyi]|uniref:Uncharacterized protein n=1 Tax=Pseudalkalibacillus berkeleyi TaxID=1069813 RepID=A0ABS9GWX1_9BACL|nr:hypothetical protein [Pseudalkalibacillus berkeleyi]MCF6136321.1 hypothetical protein [Pseudalkalibacillus berkeleyi]